jgi:hypothetical protein
VKQEIRLRLTVGVGEPHRPPFLDPAPRERGDPPAVGIGFVAPPRHPAAGEGGVPFASHLGRDLFRRRHSVVLADDLLEEHDVGIEVAYPGRGLRAPCPPGTQARPQVQGDDA